MGRPPLRVCYSAYRVGRLFVNRAKNSENGPPSQVTNIVGLAAPVDFKISAHTFVGAGRVLKRQSATPPVWNWSSSSAWARVPFPSMVRHQGRRRRGRTATETSGQDWGIVPLGRMGAVGGARVLWSCRERGNVAVGNWGRGETKSAGMLRRTRCRNASRLHLATDVDLLLLSFHLHRFVEVFPILANGNLSSPLPLALTAVPFQALT
jgi:hypothetical protein